MKKLILISTALLFMGTISAQKLVKLWQTEANLKVPESVLFDSKNNVLYVSNVDGTDAWGKDGKGSVGKISPDGKIIATDWVTGLNAPKGLGMYKDNLYVADISEVVVISINQGKIIRRIPVAGAEGLNDISVDSKGAVYVSDSKLKKVHKIENGVVSTLLENLKGPNGVLMHGNDLYVLDAGGMYKMGNDGSMKMITDGMDGGTDGIENITGNDYIVSCWSGVIWYVKGDGSKTKLLDTREEKINSADIGINPAKKIIYVPTFWKNSVVAYAVK